jgi:hypothetical protein
MNIQPFTEANRLRLAKAVVERAQAQKVLPGIQVDHSYERGFYIDATPEWRSRLSKFQYWVYAGNERQLRFGFERDGMISTLKWKDGIPSWSDDEVKILIEIINNEVYKL